MPTAVRMFGPVLLVLSLPPVGCGEEQATPAELSAEYYVYGYCDKGCERSFECGDTSSLDVCLDTCVEDRTLLISGGYHCVEENTEFNRCRFDLFTCGQLADIDFSGDPSSPCAEWLDENLACLAVSDD